MVPTGGRETSLLQVVALVKWGLRQLLSVANKMVSYICTVVPDTVEECHTGWLPGCFSQQACVC